jgi:hypothetical protein
VAFALPAGATDVELTRDGRPLPSSTQREGSYEVLEDFAALDPGAETTWTLRYRVTFPAEYSLRVVPQPLAVDAELVLDVQPRDDAFFRGVTYDDPFDSEKKITARPGEGSWWERTGRKLRRFWTEPVRL